MNETINEQSRKAEVTSGSWITEFKNADDFHNYIIENKPREIWNDEFSTDDPFIVLDGYSSARIRGVYNKQSVIIVSDTTDTRWLFEPGLYVKNRW